MLNDIFPEHFAMIDRQSLLLLIKTAIQVGSLMYMDVLLKHVDLLSYKDIEDALKTKSQGGYRIVFRY